MGNGDTTDPDVLAEAVLRAAQSQEERIERLKEEADALDDLQQRYNDIADNTLTRVVAGENAVKVLQKEKALIDEQLKSQEWLRESTNRTIEGRVLSEKEFVAYQVKRLAQIGQEIHLQKEVNDELNKRTLSLQDATKAGQDLGKALGNVLSTANSKKAMSMMTAIGGATKNTINLGRGAYMAGKAQAAQFKKANEGASTLAAALMGVGGAAKFATKALGPLLMLAPIALFIGEVASLVTQFDSMEKSFRKGTLASQAQADAMSDNFQAMRGFGLSAEQAERSEKALFQTFTDFTKLTPGAQQKVRGLTTSFELLGVSGDKTAKAFQTATKSWGMSVPQATDAINKLKQFSQSAGLDFEQMVTKFGEAGPALAKFADQGQTFMNLQRIMKVTGMEMQDLLRITDKFDTFEGAAEQAGKLNAALGGNFVNAMDLMMATDPAERFEMIRNSILDAGLSFADMSYYQRKYFAEAAGLENVDDLSKMLSGDLDANNKAMEAQAETLDELKQLGYEMIPIFKQFGIAFQRIFEGIDAERIQKSLTTMVNTFMSAADAVENLQKWMSTLMGIGAALLVIFFVPAGGVVSTIVTVLGALALGFYVVSEAMKYLMGVSDEHNSWSFQELWPNLTAALQVLTKVIGVLMTPFSAFVGLIKTVSDVAGNITGLFVSLANPEAAANIMRIGTAIGEIPTRKNVEFVTSMAAASTAAATSEAMGAATTGDRVASMTAGSELWNKETGRMEQYEYNINVIDKNGTVTDKHILKVVGRDIEATMRQQPRTG